MVKFIDILYSLTNGGKFRRQTWVKSAYIQVDKYGRIRFYNHKYWNKGEKPHLGGSQLFCPDDFEYKDWEKFGV